MYSPKYTITDSLLNNIVKLEVEKNTVEKTQLSTKLRNRFSKRTKSLNILHFAHILGINLTLKDAEKIADGKKLVTEDARGTILNNYRNVLEFTRSNISDSYIDIDLNIILHLNKILLTDWRETWEAKLRTGGEELDLSLENWANLRDQKIEAIQIQAELTNLLDWYKSSMAKTNNLIRIAVFIVRLVEICPFIFVNKLTAIAVCDFLLYKNGYVANSFLPTSRNFDIYEDEYLEAWNQRRVDESFDPALSEVPRENSDITLWVERFIRNLGNDMLEVREEIQKLVGEEEESSKQPFLDLNKRQLKILRYLQTIPTVKREDYVQMMDVSTMTAFRDLNTLVKKKLLKIEGQGRGTKYMLANR